MSGPFRNACRRITEEVCVHVMIYTVGSFVLLWLLASLSLIPIGIGLYVAYDKQIGTILMSTGGVCLFITIVYAFCIKFTEYYYEEVARAARRRQMNSPNSPATVIPMNSPTTVTPVTIVKPRTQIENHDATAAIVDPFIISTVITTAPPVDSNNT